MSEYERDWFGIPRPQPPGPRVTENDNAGKLNSLSLYEQLLYDKSPQLGGMNNWGKPGDPYGMKMPDYYPPPPGNDKGRPSGKILPFKPTGMDGSDLPSPRTMPSTPGHAFGRRSYGEGEAMPPPPGQFNIRQLNETLGGPVQHTTEDVADIPKRPLPPEYQPERPIPLGELQRRFGVPRLEEL